MSIPALVHDASTKLRSAICYHRGERTNVSA